MVSFCCDACGDTLKKAQVDAHAHRCRSGCRSVSCVDCSVSFYGDDYRAHTSCVTEAERYEKSVYRGPKKGGSNDVGPEKRTPQEAWNDVIAAAAASAPPSIARIAERVAAHGNVPRKERQFRNFMANSLFLRGRDAEAVVDAVWGHLSKVREEKMKEGRAARESKDDEKGADSTAKAAEPAVLGEGEAKRKEGEGETENASIAEMTPKSVKKAIKKVLKKAPNRRMKVKELRKAVQARLMLKGREKELKRMVSQQISANEKKMKLDGKIVILVR